MNNKFQPDNIDTTPDSIAIIGMAGRFPGANNLQQFWQNLVEAKDTIDHFTDDALRQAGVDQGLIDNPYYVKAAGILDDIDTFDADFFGMSPYEASITDPQHRLFLEICWEALELTGYIKRKADVLIGVFAGMSDSTYLQNCLLKNTQFLESNHAYQTHIATSANFLATKASYHLNLTGPSLNINTACSTSLVTVIKACQSLLSHECDIAIAGGVSIRIPQISGHLYQPGGILSKDGKCRTFDKDATGTVRSDGIGVVVLKRLADALKDGDNIDAVIKSYAMNNDGAAKVSYTAPSILEQSRCIATALMNVDVASMSYIEAHGTGTPLGDPIEISALTKAFRHYTARKNYCAIGSVKTNIGHTDTAAGIAGLIKTVLILKNRLVPATINFQQPNPHINFLDSPFYVNNNLLAWEKNASRKQAGVSSFGIGGTNAHVILEEAPKFQQNHSSSTQKQHLLLLSAKTTSALNAMISRLCQHLKNIHQNNPDNINEILANTAFTLQIGRHHFEQRYALVCDDLTSAISQLENYVGCSDNLNQKNISPQKPEIIFLFPGQGAQYAQMGKFLYTTERVFKKSVDQCCELLKSNLGMDLSAILFPDSDQVASANHLLHQTQFAQPALFCIEYALAKLYSSWGIQPHALLGHSLGELTAAHLAGVFSLEDTLQLVYLRGKLMGRLDPGAMLAIQASADEILPLLNDAISIASINAPQSCVISGNHAAIDELKSVLLKKSMVFQSVITAHAFHSPMVETIIPEFVNEVKKLTRHQPNIPILSNLTGNWASANELTDPNYWGQHMRQTVQFSGGVKTLLQTSSNPLFLECGPGYTSINWVKQHSHHEQPYSTIFSMLSAKAYQQSPDQDHSTIHHALAKLWLYGVDIDWNAYHANAHHQRIALPTYPFEKKSYWIAPEKFMVKHIAAINPQTNLSRCFYEPSWRRLELLDSLATTELSKISDKYWLIFANQNTLSNHLVDRLRAAQSEVIRVYAGENFKQLSQYEYTIDPQDAETYTALLKSLPKITDKHYQVIHLWGVTQAITDNHITAVSENLYHGLYSIMFLVKAFAAMKEKNAHILLVNDYLQSLSSDEICCPTKATILGVSQMVSLEYSHIKMTTVDVTQNKTGLSEHQLTESIITEALRILTNLEVRQLAYRFGYCWEKYFRRVKLISQLPPAKPVNLKNDGVYLITGGLGGIGLALAEYLATFTSAHIALISRTVIPKSPQWQEWLDHNSPEHPHYSIINKLHCLKTKGASISSWSADVCCYDQMNTVITSIEQQIGAIYGVIHAAGVPGSGLIEKKTTDDIYKVLQPKLFGTYVLSQLFKNRSLDFIVLCSSLTSLTGSIGQFDYCAANAALDAFPYSNFFNTHTSVTTINWNGWLEVGMRAHATKTSQHLTHDLYQLNENNSVTPQEGAWCFSLSLQKKLKNLIISRISLTTLIKNTRKYDLNFFLKNNDNINENKLEKNCYTVEETIAHIFEKILGISHINLTDDFFALGGDSLSALNLISAIEKQCDARLALSLIYKVSTPVKLAEFIKKSSYQSFESTVVELNSNSDRPALFLIHPIGGTIFCYMALANQLDDQQKIYALQDINLIDANCKFDNLESMATYYLTEIQKIQPNGPYYLGGYSMGGTVAFEIAHQLLQRKESVDFLGLFDSWAIFTDQFRDKRFFEQKMRTHLDDTEKKLTDSLGSNIDLWLINQWQKMQLLLQYKPAILDSKITLFKAQTLLPEYIAIDDPTNHWQQYSKYPIDNFHVSGSHDTLFSSAHINQLADDLLNCLLNIRRNK